MEFVKLATHKERQDCHVAVVGLLVGQQLQGSPLDNAAVPLNLMLRDAAGRQRQLHMCVVDATSALGHLHLTRLSLENPCENQGRLNAPD